MNVEIPTNTHSLHNEKEAVVVALECTYDFLRVTVNNCEILMFSGIINFIETLEKLSADQPN